MSLISLTFWLSTGLSAHYSRKKSGNILRVIILVYYLDHKHSMGFSWNKSLMLLTCSLIIPRTCVVSPLRNVKLFCTITANLTWRPSWIRSILGFSRDATATMLVYRTMAKKFFWEFDSIIMQDLSAILPLFCTPTWPSHHVSENQE